MKKFSMPIITIGILYIIIISSLFIFATGDEKSLAQWITYGFITISIILLIIGILYQKSKDVILSLSSLLIYFTYFLVENIYGFFLIFFEKNGSITFISISQLIILCIFLIFLIINGISNTHTQENLIQTASKMDVRNEIINKVRVLYSINNNTTLKKCIDELISSPLKRSKVNPPLINNSDEKILILLDKIENSDKGKEEVSQLYDNLLKEIIKRKALLNC